jgi:hypothetical protein
MTLTLLHSLTFLSEIKILVILVVVEGRFPPVIIHSLLIEEQFLLTAFQDLCRGISGTMQALVLLE